MRASLWAALNVGVTVSYSTEAISFFSRLATQPTQARKALYNTLISSLVSAGVWAKLDTIYLFAAADDGTALTNLVQSSYGAAAVGSPAFTVGQGFLGSSGKYIDTGFNPASANGRFGQDDASHFAWSLKAGADPGSIFGNALRDTKNYIDPRYTDNKFYSRVNSSGDLIATVTTGAGLSAVSRSSSTQLSQYRDGALVSTLTTGGSLALSSSNLVFLDGVDGFYSGIVALGGFGRGLTSGEHAALYSACHSYLQAVTGIA